MFVCRFFREHNEGSGCVVKMPYTTNREFCHFAKSEDVLIGTIRLAISRYTGIMPYVMVQPCMVNPRETKVVCWNGVAKWIAHNGSTRGKSISKFPHAELFRFVEMAIAELKQQCPALKTVFLCDFFYILYFVLFQKLSTFGHQLKLERYRED